MVYDIEKIRKALEKPQPEIAMGTAHQRRINLHAKPAPVRVKTEGLTEFTDWVGGQKPPLLPASKFKMFDRLLTVPIETNELTGRIFTNLKRVFSAHDKVCEYRFDSAKDSALWSEVNKESFWETEGWEHFMHCIDSVLVIDQPDEEETPPKPYMYFVPISSVVHLDMDGKELEGIMFTNEDYLYAFDEYFYRKFEYQDNKLGPLVAEVEHGYGECPAHLFWSDRLNTINAKHCLTDVLSRLDWLLLHKTAKKYMDISNSYPITVALKQDQPATENNRPEAYKANEGNAMLGPGSYVGMELNMDGTVPDMEAVRLISPDVTTLEFHVKEETRLMDEVFKSVVGFDGQTKEAMNEEQVGSIWESRQDVLLGIARNFEIIRKWADDFRCRIIFGESFMGCTISYGSQFYLHSAEDVQKELKQAKDNGASDAMLEILSNQMLNAKYKHSPSEGMRARIMYDLDPLPLRSVDEAVAAMEKGLVSRPMAIIKMNMPNYIRRFEREQGSDLLTFGSEIPYERKINIILEKLKTYANEMQQTSGSGNTGE